MKRDEIKKELQSFVGASFATRSEIADFLGYSDPHNIDYLIRPLERVGKKYFIADVATAIYENSEVQG